MAGGKCPQGHMELCNKACEWFMKIEQTCPIKVTAMAQAKAHLSKPKSRSKKKEDNKDGTAKSSSTS